MQVSKSCEHEKLCLQNMLHVCMPFKVEVVAWKTRKGDEASRSSCLSRPKDIERTIVANNRAVEKRKILTKIWQLSTAHDTSDDGRELESEPQGVDLMTKRDLSSSRWGEYAESE